MSCYYPIKRRYTSLTLSVRWSNRWETSTGSLISLSEFQESKTWSYVDFKPSQIENRFSTPQVGEPPMVVPCTAGTFTFYQECCNPGAYRKPYNPNSGTYSPCYKDVFALFDEVDGVGYLSGTVTVTGIDPGTYHVDIPITWAYGHSWLAAGKNGINVFSVPLPSTDKVPYKATDLTYPTQLTGLVDFEYFEFDYIQPGEPGYIEPGQPGYPATRGIVDADSVFSFAYITATSGPTWTCSDNVGNMGFSLTGQVAGTWQDPATNYKYTPDIRVTLTLT